MTQLHSRMIIYPLAHMGPIPYGTLPINVRVDRHAGTSHLGLNVRVFFNLGSVAPFTLEAHRAWLKTDLLPLHRVLVDRHRCIWYLGLNLQVWFDWANLCLLFWRQ